jgi:exo-1,4-beta-D-glucosaminidase
MQPTAIQFHAGTPGMDFQSIGIFNNALAKRLGAPTSLEDWVKKAQLMNYEAERAEFEAYGARKFARTTGLVHWLLNNGWPSLIWHLYDHSLLPAASFYGAKKANEPLHAVYGYDDRSVIVVNNTMKAETGLSVDVRIFGSDGVERSMQTLAVASVEADGVWRAGTVPAPAGVAGTYFVNLELRRGTGLVSNNIYWLSTSPDVMNYKASTWLNTPALQFGNLLDLVKVPTTTVRATVSTATAANDARVSVTLENSSKSLAFFLRLTLRKTGDASAIVPVFWDDNYITVPPGAQRTVTATCASAALGGALPEVEIEGVNVARFTAAP